VWIRDGKNFSSTPIPNIGAWVTGNGFSIETGE